MKLFGKGLRVLAGVLATFDLAIAGLLQAVGGQAECVNDSDRLSRFPWRAF